MTRHRNVSSQSISQGRVFPPSSPECQPAAKPAMDWTDRKSSELLHGDTKHSAEARQQHEDANRKGLFSCS